MRPFEQYIQKDLVHNHIGIRADENRDGYISHKPNLKPVYPFKEVGITLSDGHRMLESSGLGLPGYYRWRSRPFTWTQNESLEELEQPDRTQAIKQEHARRSDAGRSKRQNKSLTEVFLEHGLCMTRFLIMKEMNLA